VARKHIHEYGTTEEQMAMVAVKNHEHGSKNPNAQFRNKISVEDVMNSQYVAEPLKLLDCSPITDGAAAVILSKEKNDVEIIASTCATDEISIHNRDALTTFKSTVIASKNAYQQAGIDIKDIDVIEVHDCFTIAELLAVEDLGLVKKGESGKAYEEGRFRLGDKPTINPSGGLKACGHPVGATGVKQIVELTLQLRGEAKDRQVNAEYGLAHNIGGTGGTCVVHILKKV
jgi:acetyl-CoA C-acetyltransferase